MKPSQLRLLSLAVLLNLIVVAVMDARVLINEVHINPPGGSDERYQYIEILTVNDANVPHAESLDGVSVLFLDSNGGMVGTVTESLNLSGRTTGANGLLLIGQDYDTSLPWVVSQETAVADFAKLKGAGGSGDIGPKSGLTVLLVQNFTGKPGDDLDGDDDGALGQEPWTSLLDSIGYGDLPFETELMLEIIPENLSRSSANRLQNTTKAWYGGRILNTEGFTSVTFENPFGPFTGTATPGLPNQGPPAENPIRINEVLINPPRSDANNEFIELISTSGGITGTNNLWLLIVDSDRDGGQGGIVREAWNLTGQATGTNGLLVLGNNYSASSNPWKQVISPETSLFDPNNNTGGSSMGDDDIGPNGALSILLVKSFTGKAIADGIVADDLDTDDDGVLDRRPWDTSVGDDGILDSVGFDQRNDQTGEVFWQTYALGDVTQTGNLSLTEPDCLTRNPNNMAPNSGSAWMGGNIGGDSSTGIAYRSGSYFFGDFPTQITPGLPNPAEAPTQELILFNEVHVNPPGDDANFEYIEFLSPSQTSTAFYNLTLLIVDVSGLATGEIKNAIDLHGLSTGPNGLVILGDSYNDNDIYSMPPSVHREDPPGLNLGEIGPNNDLALLLVENFTGIQTDDLDTDDDGRIDHTPWTSVMDGVGFGGDFMEENLVANLNSAGINPDSICRLPFNFQPRSSAAWYGGKLIGESSTTLVYGESFGPFMGAASPGQLNLAAPHRTDAILINELHVNPPGNDGRFEFIEIISASGKRQSTNGLSLVMVENTGARVGQIERAWSLDGLATGSNGLLLLGDGYTPVPSNGLPITYWDRTLSTPNITPNTPYGDAVNPVVTAVADPLTFDSDDIGPNDGFALILVRGFNGAIGDDIDGDDNGIIETYPWNDANLGILDSIGFVKWIDTLTPPAFDGYPLSMADVSQKTFVPDTLARHVGNLTPNSLGAWFGGDVAGASPDGLSYDASTFGLLQGVAGAVTPGLPNGVSNSDGAADDDNDGVSNDSEAIAGTDPFDNTDFLRITTTTRDAQGVTLQWSSVTDRSYVIEYSRNLVGWILVSAAPIPGQGASSSFTDSDTTRLSGAEGYYRARVVSE